MKVSDNNTSCIKKQTSRPEVKYCQFMVDIYFMIDKMPAGNNKNSDAADYSKRQFEVFFPEYNKIFVFIDGVQLGEKISGFQHQKIFFQN